jgi:hypothetical protein
MLGNRPNSSEHFILLSRTRTTSPNLLVSLHPEIDDFRMEHSAISTQQSAKDLVIMRFFLKAESEMLIALIRK